jgi:autotransporter-associated beta strand protein
MNAIVWGRWVTRLFRQRRARRPQSRRRLAVESLEDRVTPATTFVWTGLGSNNNWSTGANWQGNVAPTSLAVPDLVFNSVTPRMNTNNDIISLSVNSITISASNYTLSGAKLFLNGNVTVGSGASNERMNMDVGLTAASSITIANVADLTVTGHLSGSPTVTKKGVGTLSLTNDNSSFSGAIDVQSGRLIMSHVDALGTAAAATTVEANAQLQIRNVVTPISESLILNGPGPINDGALLNFAGNSIWAGTITIDSDATFGAAAGTVLTVPGLITDLGSTGGHNLTKVGPGQLIFNHVGGNTYRGQTVINNGILTIRDPQSLGAGATFGTPQNGSPQSATIVNFNSTINEAGTLELELTAGVSGADPNAVLQDPTQPFNPVTNPVVGFQVFNDILVLNGPGFNGLGALHNLAGKNIWNGDVSLGGPVPNTSDVTIGVETNTVLTVEGVVSDDPTRTGADIPALHKIQSGKLIFDNANTYRGNTLVEFGILTARDSRALGSPAGTGAVTVVPNPAIHGPAALEYEVDRGFDGTPARSQGRNLGYDSVRHTGLWQEIVITSTSGTFTITFDGATTAPLAWNASAATVQAALEGLSTIGGGNVAVTQNANVYRVTFTNALNGVNVPLMVAGGSAGAVINDAYGLTVSKNILVRELGINNAGALRSVSGLNQQTGNVTIGAAGAPTGSIGVDPDTRVGHPTADNSYFTYDYRLAITTPDGLDSGANTKFVKVGTGQLVLPVANTELNGPTEVWNGWITIQNNESFGRPVVDLTKGDTAQPNVVTVRGGAAVHLLPLFGDLTLANRMILAGQGITHPFAMLDQGAVLSLRGHNRLTGDIGLTTSSLGGPPIPGANLVGIGVDDPITTNPPGDSTLTATGTFSDFVSTAITITGLTASGGAEEQAFVIDTGSTAGRILIDYDFYFVPDQLRVYYPPRAQGGALIFDSGVINGNGTFTINYGPGTSTFIEIVMNEGGQDPGTVWDLLSVTIIPAPSPGGNGIRKMGSHLLSLQGDATFTGDVLVQSGTLRAQHDSALGRNSSGTAATPSTQSYTTTKTTVQPGGTLQLDSTIPQNAGGFAAGVQIWDERLVLSGAAQQVQVSGSAGTFSLTFNGQTTAALNYNATAAEMQAALNALSTVNGAATVTKAGSVYTVTFGNSLAGLNNPLLTAQTSAAPGNVTVAISGTNAPLAVLAEDSLWRGPITLATNTVIDVADDSRLILYGPIDDALNLTSPSGSSLTVGLAGSGNTGELVLAGANTYRGTTTVNQGILTVTNNQALGGIGGAEVQTVTVGGATTGTFTLTFDGKTTGPIAATASALAVQNALNALATVGGVGGQAAVTQQGNVYTITFGGALSGADQPTLTAAGAGGTTAAVATTAEGFGGTVVSDGAQLQLQGSVIVGGESLTVMGSGVSAANVPDAIPVRWFSIGPSPINGAQTAGNNASTGRVTGVAVDPSDPNVIYISTAGGGAWKTKNSGRTWSPLFDNTAAMFSGAIAVAPSDPRIIYLGTGEPNNSGDSFYGTGVYKSTDSGKTWTLITNVGGGNPLNGTAVSRIVVDPSNPNRPYVATSDISTVNGNPAAGTAGVWTHTGTTWVNLTAITSSVRLGNLPTPNSGFPTTPVGTPGPDDDWRIEFPSTFATYSDLSFGQTTDAFGGVRPALYMALGTPRFLGGDDRNAVYRLIDPAGAGTPASTHWYVGDGNPATNGTHTYSQGGGSAYPRTGPTATIKVAASGQTVYSVVTDGTTGAVLRVNKSTNGGKAWADTTTQPPNMLNNQGEYDSAIAVSPTNPNMVAVVGCVDYLPPDTYTNQVVLSTDGGATWHDISIDSNGNGPHTDDHAVAFDSQGRIVVGNDGGMWRFTFTPDPNDPPWIGTWTNINGGGLAITTFNGISQHPTNPDIVLGGSQDNGTEMYSGNQPWGHVDLGDGGEVYFDPNDPSIAYHVLNGRLRKSIDGGNTWFEANFFAPGLYFSFVVDPINSARLVLGTTDVFESLNGGQTFTNLQSPLFFLQHVAIPSYQGDYQFDPDFPLVTDKGASTYDPDTIYATDGGALVVTKNHAATWTPRFGPNTRTPPGSGSIESITVDPRDRDTVYVIRQGAAGSGRNRIFKSTNAGRNWTDITANLVDIPGLATDIPLWKSVIDPRNGNIYLGTDQGVWVLRAGTGNWDRFGVGLPNVQVKELDLNLNLNILTVGSYGRSAFQFYLDDVQADSGALRASSGHSSWTGPVRLGGPTTISVGGTQDLNGAAAATLDLVGVVSDKSSGNFTLTKDGGGTLILSGANTYGGFTDVVSGVLGSNNPDALGTFRAGPDIVAQGGTRVESGATLQMQADLEAEPIVLNGNGVDPGLNGHNIGALRNISGNNTYTGVLTLGSNATIGVDSGSQLTIGVHPTLAGTGTIAGGFDLTKELTGTLVLTSNNSGFTGGTTIIQGAERVEHAGALGTGGTGVRVIDGGQIQLRTPTSGPNAGQPVVVNAPLVLSGTGIFGTGALLNAGGNNAWTGPITLATLPGFSPDTFPFGAVSINVPGANDTLTLAGPIAEFAPTGLTKIGLGELVLANSNSYSGATEVVQGTINARDPGAVGTRSGTSAVQRLVTLSADQTGQFLLSFNGQTTPLGTLPWNASENTVKSALEALPAIGSGNIASVTKLEIETLTQDGPGLPQTGFMYTIVFGGSLANTQLQLTAEGRDGMAASASVVALGGVDVRVAAGAGLELDATGSANPNGFAISGHKLTISGNGVGGHGALDNIAGNNTWAGQIELATNAAVGANALTSLTLPSGVSGSAFDFIKVDPGTVIFTSGGNNQARTVVNAGTVEVDGPTGVLGAVRLAGGNIGGTGVVGAITANAGAPGTGGAVSPGVTFPATQIGTLAASSTALNSSNVFFVNLANPAGTPLSDLLQVAGNINLGGASLAGLVASNVGLGDSFTIITAGSVTGMFAGQSTTPTEAGALGATIAYVDNVKFVVNYMAASVILSRQLANATMSLAPTIAAPVYGQREKWVATIVPESPNLAASGTVIFTVIDPDGNNFQFPVAIDPSTNTATFDPSAPNPDGFGEALQLGVYSISASYDGVGSNGSPFFNPTGAGPIQTTVIKAGTSTALNSSVNPSGFGQNVTFTATVSTVVSSPAPNTLAPFGTVTFRDLSTNTTLGTITLTPGAGVFSTASISVSSLLVGSHSIRATYNGDGGAADNYLASQSPILTQIVNKATTTTQLVGSPPSVTYGQPVTFTATVTGQGAGTPTGNVTFKLGGTTLGTSVLNGAGVATFTTSPFQLPGGQDQTITAVYNGDGNHNSSTGTFLQDVNPVASATSVTTSASPVGFGEPVTFTATVSSTLAGDPRLPGGVVTFIMDGSTTLGVGTLNALGVTTFTTSTLPIGNHTITAEYGGDTTYLTSSGSVPQSVTPTATTTTLNVSPAQGTALRAFTFTVHVAPTGSGSTTPTGDVIFVDQTTNTTLGSATLDANGDATFTHHLGGPVGFHAVRAQFQGDGNNSPSSDTVTIKIIANGTRTSTVVLRSSENPSIEGRTVTFTATVLDSGPLPRLNPGGSIQFFNKTTGEILGYANLVVVATGVTRATLSTNALVAMPDPQEIVAKYSGNATFARVNDSMFQTVKPVPTRTSSISLAEPANQPDPSVFGQSLSFTATVTDTGSGGTLTPTGTVTFVDQTTNTVLGTAILSGSGGISTATLTTNVLAAGAHSIVATYDGNTDFAPGPNSNAVTQTVTQASSTLALTSSAGTSKFGQAVTFRATVGSSTGGGVPTGTVTFFIDGNVAGTGTINAAGVATFTTSSLAVGSYTVTATYGGDGNFTGSNGTLAGGQTVNKAATTATLTRSTGDAGAPLTLTATILPVAPGGGVPTGTVTFVIDGVTRGVVDLSNGVASLFLPNGLSQGSHTIVVKYAGSGNHTASNTTFIFNFGGRVG